MTSVEVSLSQESLFFPLPFTNASIENVVQVHNRLAADSTNRKLNVVAFKVLSAVRHRYSVRPATGFIAPGEAITIHFSLDPESIRSNPDPQFRVLPTEKTKDAIYIDFAIVVGNADDVGDSRVGEAVSGKYLNAWLAAGGHVKGVNERQPVSEECGAFWKGRGAAKPSGDSSSLRKKLVCVFANRDSVPESLVVCMKAEGGSSTSAARASAPPPPTSRPPPTTATHRDSTAPPEVPPRRFSVSSPSVSITPRASQEAARTPSRQTANGDNTAAAAATPSSFLATTPPAAAVRHGAVAAAAGAGGGRRKPFSLQQAAMAFSSEKAEKHKAMWKRVMHYKIPYTVAAAMVLLALYCGLCETHTFFSWLIAGR